MTPIIDGAWLLKLGVVNAVLLDGPDGLALVDSGFPGRERDVLRAVGELGRPLRHLVLTHAHPDHIGSAGAVQRATGAQTWIHAADAALARSGGPFRAMTPAPGLLQKAMFRMVWDPGSRVEPVRIDHEVQDGDTLPVAGGLRVVHAPGHCAGQVALVRGPLLLAADVMTNLLRVDDPIGFEDRAQGQESQRRLAALDCDAAAFGHGAPIRRGAAERLRRRWK